MSYNHILTIKWTNDFSSLSPFNNLNFSNFSSSFVITCEFEPRFRDTDRVGHVNNAVFATYFELVRFDWVKKVRKLHPDIKFQFIIARVEIDYLSPIYLGDRIKAIMWVEHIGNKSWTFAYSLDKVGSDIQFAKGKTVQVAFDYTENQSVTLNEEIRSILTPHLKDD